MFFRFTAK